METMNAALCFDALDQPTRPGPMRALKAAGFIAATRQGRHVIYAALYRRLAIFGALPVGSLDRMALKTRLDELADPHAMAR